MIDCERITVIPAPQQISVATTIKLAKTRSGDQLMVVIDPEAFNDAYIELAGELNRAGNKTMKASLLKMADAVALIETS